MNIIMQYRIYIYDLCVYIYSSSVNNALFSETGYFTFKLAGVNKMAAIWYIRILIDQVLAKNWTRVDTVY